MTVYFQGAELEDFVFSSAAHVSVTTNAAHYYAANARAAMQIATGTVDTTYIETQPFEASEFWTHVAARTYYLTGTVTPYQLGWFANGVARIGVQFTASSVNLRYWTGAAWVTIGTYPMGDDALRTVDVYIKVGNPGEVRLYINALPIASSVVIDTTFGGTVSSFSKFRLANIAQTGGIVSYSEVILASWNTIGAKLVTRAPVSAGTWNEWTGLGYSAVDEVPYAGDMMVSGSSNQRFSLNFADVPALGTGESLQAVKISGAMVKDAGGPQSVNFFARIESADYDDIDQAAPAVINTTNPLSKLWEVSPATGQPWTLAELNAAEFGVRSRP
jgi:hypothetical protein